jgi:hypothetical protein
VPVEIDGLGAVSISEQMALRILRQTAGESTAMQPWAISGGAHHGASALTDTSQLASLLVQAWRGHRLDVEATRPRSG